MSWSNPVDGEVVAIHAALLPTSPEGDILYFEGDDKCRLYHVAEPPSIERFTTPLPNSNTFCAGHAFLPDGTLLVAGGTSPAGHHHPGGMHMGHYDGVRDCWLYHPRDKRWERTGDLSFQPGSSSKGGGRWYPTLVLLANREVFAAGGHPHETDDHPQSSQPRENNNTPEIFSLGTKSWRLLNGDITAPDEVVTDNYPRFRLLPSGLLFTDTEGNRGTRRLFNPVSGRWEGPNVDVSALPSDYKVGSNETSVLLPLLPPNYPVRVLACNSAHPTAFRVDVDETPRWFPTARRQGIPGKKPGEGRKPPASMTVRRANACAVLLPTGQVFLTGGVIPSGDEHVANTPVYEPELYTPGIDFVKGAFRGADSWETLADPSPVPRGYHATALLLPDGRVWTAGSQEGFAWYELRVAIYSPWYVGRNRAQILDVVGLTRLPNGKRPALLPGAVAFIRYGATFEITVSRPIARVALMRCGAVTHAFDSEQRYVGLKFTRRGSKRRPRFTVTAPPNGNVAPPGYYMLWVVNSQGVPCERAAFVLLVASTLRKPRPPRRKPKRPPFPRGPKKRSPKKKPPPKRPRRKR